MDANQTCEILLSHVKKSNLNFSLRESPFSVSLTIKKTFVKDKNGVSHASNIGTPECSCQRDKLQLLQDEISALKAAAECDDANLVVDKTKTKPDQKNKNSAIYSSDMKKVAILACGNYFILWKICGRNPPYFMC